MSLTALPKKHFVAMQSTIDFQKLRVFWKMKSVTHKMTMVTPGYKTRIQLECEK